MFRASVQIKGKPTHYSQIFYVLEQFSSKIALYFCPIRIMHLQNAMVLAQHFSGDDVITEVRSISVHHTQQFACKSKGYILVSSDKSTFD